MASDFVVFRPGTMRDGVCKLRPPLDVASSFEIDEAVPRLARWKPTARSEMSPDFPKDIALADSLYGATFVVVSGAVRSALDGEGVRDVEYLPLQIINHKGRVASRDHFIVNALRVVDCIDDVASQTRMNAIRPTDISSCRRLVIRAAAVPAEAALFRPERWRALLLIRREIAGRLVALGLGGLCFVEPDQYTGLY